MALALRFRWPARFVFSIVPPAAANTSRRITRRNALDRFISTSVDEKLTSGECSHAVALHSRCLRRRPPRVRARLRLQVAARFELINSKKRRERSALIHRL